MNIEANIKGVEYTPYLCKELKEYSIDELENSLSTCSNFIINIDSVNKIAISWWVSAKRTRSYPYARVYDTLKFSGKKLTIIPIFKDEGKDGDRDFLQWDTISLMSLLGIYVIISYYKKAEKNLNYENKITNQRFDVDHIKNNINNLISYQSDALHWNLKQIDNIGEIGEKALLSYNNISEILKIKMHSYISAEKRIKQLQKGKEKFMTLSRELAQKAQIRESNTIQPKESLSGDKSIITIKNYLGGYYYFTADEAYIRNNTLHLVEGKHSKESELPSLEDIKDGLLKMVLFTNLDEVKINNKKYEYKAKLKLSCGNGYNFNKLTDKQKEIINLLEKEKNKNKFDIELI